MTPAFLVRLMTYKALSPAASARLKAEERLTVAVANMLRQATLQGRLCAVWCHVPNEHQGHGRLHQMRVAVKKAMGLIPGASDLFFLWDGGSGVIELKVEAALSDNQKAFRDWCSSTGVRHAVCKSLIPGLGVRAVEDVLAGWGVLTLPMTGPAQ